MASDLSQLELRYINACKNAEVLPNYSILSSFSKVKHQNIRNLEIFLDQLVCSDIPPLVYAFSPTSLVRIDAIDICQKSPNLLLKGEHVLSLLHAVNTKLRVVDLIDWPFWKNILQDICYRGLACRILNLRFSPIRKLNMSGKFMQLQTLNLDYSIHLTSFQIHCFSCMPKLMHLSVCATKVSNLWTTCAALSKLPSLVELRFQNCLCCYGTGPCPRFGGVRDIITSSNMQTHYVNARQLSLVSENFLLENLQYITSESSSDLFWDCNSSESDLSSSRLTISDLEETLHDAVSDFDENVNLSQFEHGTSATSSLLLHSPYQFIEEIPEIENDTYEIDDRETSDEFSNLFSFSSNYYARKDSNIIEDGSSISVMSSEDDTETTQFPPKRPISHHPSSICFEKYYREYMISSLARLEVLDNLPVTDLERQKSYEAVTKCYEYVPYNRHSKESVVGILQNREIGTIPYKLSHTKQPCSGANNHSYTRSLSAAKVCSSPWPSLYPISKFKNLSTDETKNFHPRQFEYHPSNPSLMVFGTLNGEVVVLNHESQKLVGYLPSVGSLSSILGLCWLQKYPSKLIAGSDNGSLQLLDVSQMPSTVTDRYGSFNACMHTFDEFEQLTSVNINSTDEYFVASGFSKHVALYDLGSGRRLQFLKDLHHEHINVVKFCHHSPTVFATASFDQDVKMWDLRQGTSQPCYTASSSRGNVMVCFSPDDHYLLATAIDNEVKQLLAVDGRLHMEFEIASIGSAQNYTRSYYMNGRDYIISGSCEENVVRVCCAQTGRRLKDVSLEGMVSRYPMFVQSLRGDPFRTFNMSVLAAYLRPSTVSEIIKVNLLASDDHFEEDFSISRQPVSSALGG